jgi:hypothetical protein
MKLLSTCKLMVVVVEVVGRPEGMDTGGHRRRP